MSWGASRRRHDAIMRLLDETLAEVDAEQAPVAEEEEE